MTVEELRNRLHVSIDQIQDEDILNSIYYSLEKGNTVTEGLLENNNFLDKLELGMSDIENGRTISLKDSNEQIKEWLTK